ncbi:hypothetical protein K504DRAFT_420030 [Pleomassaria siparia CBS 279.74]|uniref:TMEM205-like domain-containing protein n=1 Tax=Pleomassaria siparia CBS 279.74 TaxID=1314801 RepID=A0A6G1KNT6_9PLEO|nr:hypothetical protein K504DRAFT_420030 [Pleomassaria siparia CBS 279.74]
MGFNGFTPTALAYLPGLAPFHLFAYSTLLGTQLYQSFVMTKECFQALPRLSFTTLQKRLFPIYLRCQSLLLILAVVTFPSRSVLSLVQHKEDWIPFVIAGVTAGLNLILYRPRTQRIMIDSTHQKTRDARKVNDTGEMSGEMRLSNQAFSRAYAMSMHSNLINIGATLWYGLRLGSRLSFETT